MNREYIEQIIREYISKYDSTVVLRGYHIKELAWSIADRLQSSWQKDFKEAYEQGKFDATYDKQ